MEDYSLSKIKRVKQQIIELKKKLLLVELPEDTIQVGYSMFDNKGSCYLEYYTNDKKCIKTGIVLNIDSKNYKLTDITEIQCEEWVEWIEEPQYYIDYRKEGWQGDITAKESFFSKLEADGIHFENPLGEKPVLDKESLWGSPEQDTQAFAALNYQIDKWEEAESKIWGINNCYLFLII